MDARLPHERRPEEERTIQPRGAGYAAHALRLERALGWALWVGLAAALLLLSR